MHLNVVRKGGNPMVVALWESLDEPRQVAEQMRNAERKAFAMRHYNGQSSEARNPERWLGAPSIDELRKRLREGWPEGVERLLKLAVRDIQTQDVRRRRVRADQGDELDMQAVYRGNLSQAWTRTRRVQRTHQRDVTIVCNISGNAALTADQMFWRGASALRLAEALDAAGYNVGIYAAECGKRVDDSNSKGQYGQFVEIKAPDRPLDLSRLAALTCMPGYFRTSLFCGIAALTEKMGLTVGDHLGYPAHDLMAEAAAHVGLTGCIVQPEVNDERSAAAWLEQAMAQIEQPEQQAA